MKSNRLASEGHVVHAGVNCVCNVCDSAHSCGCVINGQFCLLILLFLANWLKFYFMYILLAAWCGYPFSPSFLCRAH